MIAYQPTTPRTKMRLFLYVTCAGRDSSIRVHTRYVYYSCLRIVKLAVLAVLAGLRSSCRFCMTFRNHNESKHLLPQIIMNLPSSLLLLTISGIIAFGILATETDYENCVAQFTQNEPVEPIDPTAIFVPNLDFLYKCTVTTSVMPL